jgi:hypothetical protein
MNWKLDTNSLYIWRIEGTPFGVEKVDNAYYLPFRMWGNARVYVTAFNKELSFRSRREAMAYTEKAVRIYQGAVIEAL